MRQFIVLLLALFNYCLFAQGGGPPSVDSELNVQIFNNANEYTVDFVLEPPYRASDEAYNREYFWALGCNCPPLYNQLKYYPELTRTVSLEGEINLCLSNGFGIGLVPPGIPSCTGWSNGDAENFQIGFIK